MPAAIRTLTERATRGGGRTRGNDPVTKRVGILDLAVDSPNRTWGEQLYSFYFRKQFVSITPQAISVW